MSFLFGNRTENRDATARSSSGFRQGPLLRGGIESSMRSIPVYAAITMLADSVAATPLHQYAEVDGHAQRVANPAQLVTNPTTHGVRYTWIAQLVASILARGNAYGLILDWDSRGIPSAVQWLDPSGMQVDETGARPAYNYRGVKQDFHSIMHIPGTVLPGRFVGMSPLGLFKTQIENGLKADRMAGNWFETGVAPTGHLKNTARKLVKGEAAGIKAAFKRAVADRDIFVSGNDWDWTALTIPAHEAQFLEMIKASATQVAAIYRLQPEDLGGVSGGSLTYSTLEMNQMMYTRRAVLPWTTRIEQYLSLYLPDGEYAKFNLDATVRADLKTRMEAHKIALEIGLETLAEGRALEDKPPLTEAERLEWAGRTDQPDPAAAKARAIGELIQKVYLGAGKVLTSDEIRDLLNAAGAGLAVPGPVFAPKTTEEGRNDG